MTTDNGSSLLKQEIDESECRLGQIKLGRPLKEVVSKHPDDFFLTNKEDYFLGEKRVLRKQERENALKEKVEEQSKIEIKDTAPQF